MSALILMIFGTEPELAATISESMMSYFIEACMRSSASMS